MLRRKRLLITLLCVLFGSLSLAHAGFCPGIDGGPGDFDGDGLPAAVDCDDTDLELQAPPGLPEELRLQSDTLSWLPPRDFGGIALPLYNAYRADDAAFSTGSCIATGLAAPSVVDSDTPLPGAVFFYLVETQNGCGGSGIGLTSAGLPRPAVSCDCGTVCDDNDACTLDTCSPGGCNNEPLPPIVRRGPRASTSCDGGTVDFVVDASGTGTLDYAWTFNGSPVGNNSPTLRLSSLSAASDDGAQIQVEITDGCTSALTPPVTLSVFSNPNSCAGGLDGQESPNGGSQVSTDIGPVRWMAPESLRSASQYGLGSESFRDRIINGSGFIPELRMATPKNRGGVHGHSGEYTRTEIDLRVASRGFDFVMSRVYRSRELRFGTLGPQWTHSFERSVEPDPNVVGNLLLHDGTTARIDSYAPSPTLPNCWEAPGFFRTLCEQPDGRFVLTFPDLHEWIFTGFNGLPDDGLIEASVDRNGNNMQFIYDPGGTLAAVLDSLGRAYDFGYNAFGQLATLTDFTGRVVVYDYYQNGDVDGSAGDLESVTSPPVLATPTGNDFPNGKQQRYVYSSGTGDGRLDHNLLAVSDGGGAVYVQIDYIATSVFADPRYDRVERVAFLPTCPPDTPVRCDTRGQSLDYVYPVLPFDAQAPTAVSSTVVTDRAGNVRQFDYDGNSNVVRERHYTGRAPNPDSPSDTTDNAPTGQVRPSDPPLYDTRFFYDANSQVVQVVNPNGGSVEYAYDSSNPDPRLRGRLTQRNTIAGPLGGDQPNIFEEWSYNDPFGPNVVPSLETMGSSMADGPDLLNSAHANRFAETYTDGRGFVHTFDYDANGNCVLWQAPVVSSGVLGGGTQNAQKSIFYNGFGQPIEVFTPGGRLDTFTYYPSGAQEGYLRQSVVDSPGFALTTGYSYDAAGNLVSLNDPRGNQTQVVYNSLDQPVRIIEAAPFLYETDVWYDGADRVVRVDRLNQDESGTTRPNSYLSEQYVYDALDRVVREGKETEAGGVCVATEFEYDANDNIVRVDSGRATSGEEPAASSERLFDERDLLFRLTGSKGNADASSVEYEYDGNGNVVRETTGIESPTGGHETEFELDGYDRVVLRTDAADNTLEFEYDANDNVVRTTVDGEVRQGSGAGPVVHFEKSCVYDERDRRILCECDHLIVDTGNPIGDGKSTHVTYFDLDDRVIRVEDDNSNEVNFTYDSVRRRETTTDSFGNTETLEYDANDNVVRSVVVDQSGLGLANEFFTTLFEYDELDRHVTTTDNLNQQSSALYDSQHDQVVLVDTQGNVVRTLFDGQHRKLSVSREITDTGTGAGSVVDTIDTLYTWNDNHLRTSDTDDNGNQTFYTYDAFDALVRVDLADGTSETATYDAHRNRVSTTDANGTVVFNTYDLLDRLVSRAISPAAGVGGTTTESYEYDALSRVVQAENDDTTVTRRWDSIGNVIEESQQIAGGSLQTVQQSYDGVGNLQNLVYPSGRSIDYSYDSLNRISSVGEGPATLSSYIYMGPSRIEFQTHGSGATTQYGYDTIGRLTQSLHSISGSPVFDIGTLWDPADNLVQLRDDLTPGKFIDFSYDSDYRLNESTRNEPGSSAVSADYEYDGADNRVSVTGGPEAGSYTLDATSPDPADFQCNQYSETPRGVRTYDDNGATLTADDRVNMVYDYRDRLLSVTTALGTTTHTYDALDRRLASSGPGGGRVYVYRRDSVIEEQDGTGAPEVTFVLGSGGLAQIREEKDQNFNAVIDRYSVHYDFNGSVRGLTTSSGLEEFYEYDDFGSPQVFNAAGIFQGTASRRGNPYLFQGQRWDGDNRLYLHGATFFDPSAARDLTRSGSPLYNDPQNKSVNPMYQPALYGAGGGHGGNGGSTTSSFGHKKGYDHYVAASASRSSVAAAPGGSSGGDPDGAEGGTRATDYNSSRSNKSFAAAGFGDSDGVGSSGSGTRATDYNSSRSNKNGSNHSAVPGDSDGDGGGSRATDYNSSRSNHNGTARSAFPGGSDDDGGGSRATDYNSSRSNKSFAAAGFGDSGGDGGGSRATDYNSSRSNKSFAAPGFGGSGGGGRGVAATDYNSSRSNKADGISAPGGGGGSGGGGRGVSATDYNSSRSNKADGIAAPDPGGAGGGGRIVAAQDYNSSRSNRGIIIILPGGGGEIVDGVLRRPAVKGGGDDGEIRIKLVAKL